MTDHPITMGKKVIRIVNTFYKIWHGNLYWTDSDYKWIMVANKAGLQVVPLTNQIEVLMGSANQRASWKPI